MGQHGLVSHGYVWGFRMKMSEIPTTLGAVCKLLFDFPTALTEPLLHIVTLTITISEQVMTLTLIPLTPHTSCGLLHFVVLNIVIIYM